MKKKNLSVTFIKYSIGFTSSCLTTVHAETTDDKIAAQDNKISNLTSQQQRSSKTSR